jgi:hypothetical protein
MDGIFISYRRDDSAGYAGRLYDRLAAHFGAGRVFMDVEGIEPGTDFVTAIENAVGSCRVLIVVIGDEWLTTTNAAGRRRLDDPNDFIRLETVTALQRDIRVVPVLVGGAAMPHADDLPEDLRPLARRQAIEVSHKQWDASTAELVRAMEGLLAGGAGRVTARVPPITDERDVEPPRRWPWWVALACLVAAVAAGWRSWSGSDISEPREAGASDKPTLSAGTRATDPAPKPAAEAVAARSPPVEVTVAAAAAPAATPAATPAPRTETQAAPPRQPTLTRPPVAAAAPARTPVVPAPPPAPGATTAPPSPTPPTAPNARGPRAGDTFTYSTSGKWPTSARRTVAVSVRENANGRVTDALLADPAAGAAGEVRQQPAATPGFVTWSVLGNEFSPYLGAFTDLAALGVQRGFATPSVDGQWSQWYSEARVLGQEWVTVPAGRFNAYKVEVSSNRQPSGGAGSMQVEPVRLHYLIWYAPEVKRYVKMQRRLIVASGAENEKDVIELVSQR